MEKRQHLIGFWKSGWSCSKSARKQHFAKRDHCETICEKITNRNILSNQFSAALTILSGPKRAPPPPPTEKKKFRGASAPLPFPLRRL